MNLIPLITAQPCVIDLRHNAFTISVSFSYSRTRGDCTTGPTWPCTGGRATPTTLLTAATLSANFARSASSIKTRSSSTCGGNTFSAIFVMPTGYSSTIRESVEDSVQSTTDTGRLFSDYPELRQHFARDHFLCLEGACQENQFTHAFRSEIDLKGKIYISTSAPTTSVTK